MFDLYDENGFARICAEDPENCALAGNEVEDFGLVEQITAKERAIARLQAEQLQLMTMLHDRYVVMAAEQKAARDAERAQDVKVAPEKAFTDGFEQTSTELSMALRVSGLTASAKLNTAVELTDTYPAALAALAAGRLTWTKITILREQTANLSKAEKAAVAEQVVGRADAQTPGQFRRAVREAVEKTDADALRERRKMALQDRGVWLNELPDGMAVSRVCTTGTGPRCRRDHRIKQTPGWKVEHHPDGSATWTTPSGHKYEYKAEPIAEPVVEKGPPPVDYDDEPPF